MTPDERMKAFRPWPDMMLPVPRVQRGLYVHAGEGAIVECDRAQPATPPDELYLRDLMNLDLENCDEIASFCTRFGALRLSYRPTRRVQDVVGRYKEWNDGAFDTSPEALEDFVRWEYEGATERDLIQEASQTETIIRAVHATFALRENLRESTDPFRTLDAFHADDFRLRAEELRDMVRILLALQGETRLHDAALEARHTLRGDSFDHQVLWLLREVNNGLDSARPRLIAQGSPLDSPFLELTGGRWFGALDPDDEVTSLDSALCIQLFNAAVATPHYKVCAFEPCGQLFIHQRGRSRHGGHSASSMYCSRECARAEQKRKERAKKRLERAAAEREGGKS